MILASWVAGFAAAATVVSASTDELQLFSRLLKRQEPGTPAYNCHDNCGQAIIQARQSADACSDDVFLADYQSCLQCSGPDNEDIWRFYGSTLSGAGARCGLSTEPLSGDQPDVGAATPAGSSSSSSSATDEPASTTPAASSSTATDDESLSETTGASESTSATEGSSATSVSATGSVTAAPTTTTGSVSETGPSSTASETVVATAAAGTLSVSGAAFYGALAFGALYVAAR